MVYVTRSTPSDPRDMFNAITEIESGPDRVLAIVGGCFVETSLTEAIKSHLCYDEKIIKEMFLSSGPLGAFSTKIRLGKLIGMYGDDAYKDLINVKNIRNDFAHKIEVSSFESQRIKNLCQNLKLADRYSRPNLREGEKPKSGCGGPMKDWDGWIFRADRDELIITSRGRYMLTVMVLLYGLSTFLKNKMPEPTF